MDKYFNIIEIESIEGLPEAVGTKEKFWILYNDKKCLVKFGRAGTGEDWAEKISCELCKLLKIEHAHYDLASLSGRSCVITPSFVPDGSRLILGNEILNRTRREYEHTLTYEQRDHTVRAVFAALRSIFHGDRHKAVWHNLIGYIFLDAWIGNTDRHHENWGLVIDPGRSVTLAPTFDHASSLGRELSDQERMARLETRDARYSVKAFAEKARSALYSENTDRRPLLTLDALSSASSWQKESLVNWAEKLKSITDDQIASVFERMPKTVASPVSVRFAQEMLKINRARILEVVTVKK